MANQRIFNRTPMVRVKSDDPTFRVATELNPRIRTLLEPITRKPAAQPAQPRPQPQPQPQPAPQPDAAPLPLVPPPPSDNPFTELPFPSAGDRIKSDDFKKLSQSLNIIYDMSILAGSLFGRAFSEARQTLIAQNYEITRVMSVFGAEIDTLTDISLDSRKVVQIAPVALGERLVTVVLTEAVDTRRYAPNLIGLTYREGMERLQALLGDMPPGAPVNAPDWVGLDLQQARDTTTG